MGAYSACSRNDKEANMAGVEEGEGKRKCVKEPDYVRHFRLLCDLDGKPLEGCEQRNK